MLLFLVLVVAFCGDTTAEHSLRAETRRANRVWRSTAKELLFDPLSRLGLRKPCLLRLVVMACVVMLLLLLLLRSWPEAGVRGVVGDRLFAIASIIVPDSDCFFPAASQVQVVACARGMFG